METKNLSKSFGVRVPLGMYMQMLEVSVKNKITITDICLYSLMNSGVLKDGFNFENGGAVNTNHITEIKRLNEVLLKSEKSKKQFRVAMEESDEEVERLKQEIVSLEQQMVDRYNKIKALSNENKRLQEEIAKPPKVVIVTEEERQLRIQRENIESYRKAEEERAERENRGRR
jgi:capsule polysaccharide export protein KpsE/RkpR